MKKVLLECSFDNEDGGYYFRSPSGSSADEVIFCIAGLIRCFDRDEVLPKEMFLDLLNKFLTDPQYDELKPSGGVN